MRTIILFIMLLCAPLIAGGIVLLIEKLRGRL
jgi:hypothetical protein